MGVRFSKSIKIGNLLKINLSKTGISASIGVKGASINLGKNGTYLNLSPKAAGISGTGISYRKKLTGGYSSLLNLGKKKDDKEIKETKEEEKIIEQLDTSKIDEFNINLEATINVHKDAPIVLTQEEFKEKIKEMDSESSQTIMNLSINGDEDTIESLIGSVMANLDLTYEANANYELEDHDLYVDLDLPEIEDLNKIYPTIEKNKIVEKEKSLSELKKEYANLVMSLGIYLGAQFFNQSSYIENIIMSAFTSKRNNAGDLVDAYLYSVKFVRKEFEGQDFSKLDDLYKFILKFENRINFQETTNTFKAIIPYEMASQTKANSDIEDALLGLKELGYKKETIDSIIPALSELKLESPSEYLKEALKLIKK